jgi:ABC-2 type transport system ATP-binding protein
VEEKKSMDPEAGAEISIEPEGRVPDDADQPGAVIRTRGLTKVYRGEIMAVDGLDLEVGRGEVFGLLGPNGAGKTTTVGLLTTRVMPTRGSATVAGVDVVANPARAKRAVGVVSQVNTLDRKLSVRENLYFHGRYFGMSATHAAAVANQFLERFRLTDRADAGVDTLSGGTAKRLMVARAVLHGPAVLFLDEPTAGLDPQSRLVLWDLIRELRQERHTVLLTTHFMEEADRLCDRVAIMDHGRLLALDTPGALKRSLGGEAEIRVGLRGDAGRFAEDLGGRLDPGAAGRPRATGQTVRVPLRESPERAIAEVVATVGEQGGTITDLVVAEPTLETVFLNLTGRELREGR